MHRSSRWFGIGLLAVSIWGSGSVIAATTAPGAATPAAATPASLPMHIYRPDHPVILISSGPMTTTLHVDRLPTDRYGVVTVATDSADAFLFTITPPNGEARNIFEADAPDTLTGALLLDQTGDYILSIEATGSWAVIIR